MHSTADHCKVQTAFVSLFKFKLFHWKATPTRAFNEFLYEFLRIFFNLVKFVRDSEFFC